MEYRMKKLIKKDIERFIKEAQKHIDVDSVILFGSSVNGKNRKWSDIDLAVVSKDFNKMTPFKRMVYLGKIAWNAKTTQIEAFGYTPEEYAKSSPTDFISEIKRTGKVLRVA
jgi:uncharacterized protein